MEKHLIPKHLPDLIVDHPFLSQSQFNKQIPEFIIKLVGGTISLGKLVTDGSSYNICLDHFVFCRRSPIQ